jgi:hypothetical protein
MMVEDISKLKAKINKLELSFAKLMLSCVSWLAEVGKSV